MALAGLILIPNLSQAKSNDNLENSASGKFYRPDSIHALFSYSNFDYNNDTPTALSNFQGTSYLSLIGGNNFHISNSLLAGLFFYNMNSYINFTQSPLAFTSETIHNNSLVGHIFKQVKPNFALDILGGYGLNSLGFNTLSTSQMTQLAHAKSQGNTWYTYLKGIYNHAWTNFSLIGTAGVLYNQVNQNGFNYFYTSIFTPATFVQSVKSQSTFAIEYAELTYKHGSKILPFINGSLIQVLQNSINTPAAIALSVGTLPNQIIDLNQNGFSVGAGFNWKHNKLSLRLEQQYYQRGNVYHSLQSIASLKYQL